MRIKRKYATCIEQLNIVGHARGGSWDTPAGVRDLCEPVRVRLEVPVLTCTDASTHVVKKTSSAKKAFLQMECIICLDSGSPLLQSGCACRGDSGLAHVACLVENAIAQRPRRGDDVWRVCQTCKQEFTGAMRTGLAEAWRARVRHQAEENQEWLLATSNLANCRRWGKTI